MKILDRSFLKPMLANSTSAEIEEGLLMLHGFYGSSDGALNRRTILERGINNRFVKWAMFTIFAPLNTLGVHVDDRDKWGEIPNRRTPALDCVLELENTIVECVERRISGQYARDKLRACAISFAWCNTIFKIINRESPKGISFGTAQKICPQITPPFSPQNCRGSIDQVIDATDYIAEEKFDGMRIWVLKLDGCVRVLSRDLNELHLPVFSNMLHELDDLNILDNYVVDCEADAGERFYSIGLCKRASDILPKDKDKLKFKVFDMIPIDEVLTGKFTEPLHYRKERVANVLEDAVWCEPAKYIRLTCLKDAYDLFKGMTRSKKEGIIVKNVNDPYVFGEAGKWIKIKLEETYDAPITRIIEGNGAKEGMAGAIECDFNGVSVRVGSGLDFQTSKWLWECRDLLVGRTCEFKTNGKTPTNSINHAVYCCIREDK
jgi:ATP-dependent DNA ligase